MLTSDESTLLGFLKYYNIGLGSVSGEYQWSQKSGDYYYLLDSSGLPLSVSSVRSSDYVFITKENNTISYGLGYNPQNVSAQNILLAVGIEAIQTANIGDRTIANIESKFNEAHEVQSSATHTITFNINGTEYVKSGIEHASSVAFSSVDSAVSTAVSDSTFSGFGLKENGLALITNSTKYNNSYINSDATSLCNITEDLTLYLGESTKTFTINFIVAGKTVSTQSVTAGEKASFTGTEPAKDSTPSIYYTFAGWLSAQDGQTYLTKNLPEIYQNTTFSAVFEQHEYPIQFNANGGTIEVTGMSYNEDGSTDAFPTPTRGNDYFNGWKVISSEDNSWPVGEIVTNNSEFGTQSNDSGYYTFTELNSTYPFTYDETAMEYTSGNAGVDNSYSLCKITFNVAGTYNFKVRSYGESSYDYAIFSNINQTLAGSNSADSDALVKQSYIDKSSEAYYDLTYENVQAGDYVTIKYIKNASTHSNDDTLKFQVQAPVYYYTGDVTLEAQWLTESYLSSDWKTRVATANSSITNTKIKSVIFTSEVPTGYTGSVSVGTNSETDTTAWSSTNTTIADVTAYYKENSETSGTYDIVIYSPVIVYAPQDSSSLFELGYVPYKWGTKASALTEINFGTKFDTSKVTNMNKMFYDCFNLTSLDVRGFNTQSVTDMSYMFADGGLTELDLKNFNTSNVKNMEYMFGTWGLFAEGHKFMILDLSNFDTKNVTNMQRMFSGCSSLTSLTFGTNFNTSSVTSMNYMFSSCSSLTSLTFGTNFNTSKVTTMSNMFYNCRSLTTLDLSNFDMTLVTNVSYMLNSCTSLTTLKAPYNVQSSYSISLPGKYFNSSSLSSGSTNTISAGSAFCSTADSKVTLTRGYVVTFNSNDGTGRKEYQGLADGKGTLNKVVFGGIGYAQGAWNTASAGTGTTYAKQAEITTALTADTSLYAQWVKQTESYLSSDWKTRVKTANSSITNTTIKSVTFTSEVPSGYTELCSVGTNSATVTTAWSSTNTTIADVTAYYKTNSSDSSLYDIVIYSPVTIYAPKSCSQLFYNLTAVTSIDFGSNFDTSKVTSMEQMFYFCSKLTTLDLSSFDTSKVTSMKQIFVYCKAITSLDLSNFNTNRVIDMSWMFESCSSLTSLTFGTNFNTSKVTNMNRMFYDCLKLTTLDLSNFDTSSVTNTNSMFNSCSSLTTLDLSNFNTSEVTTMEDMFYSCSSLTSLTFGTNFNTSSVTDMEMMFSDCSELTTLDLSNFNTNSVTNTRYMFSNCSKLTTLDLSNFNTSNVTNMEGMFNSCSALASLTFGTNFNTSSVGLMNYMFSDCSNLTTLDLSNFNTSSVWKMSGMFSGCSSLTALDLSNFKISKVSYNMDKIFYNCSSLTTLDLSGFDMTNIKKTVTDMFTGCTSLTSIIAPYNVQSSYPISLPANYFNSSSLSSGSTNKISAGSAFCSTASSKVTLTRGYVVTFNSNDGTNSKQYQGLADGKGTLNNVTFTRTGYTQGAWDTTSAGTGTTYAKQQAITTALTADTSLYAQWTANTYTITFDGQNDKTNETKIVTYGSTYGDLPTPTYLAYTFSGWWTEKDGKGTKIESTTNVTITADTTLYAYWVNNGDGDFN